MMIIRPWEYGCNPLRLMGIRVEGCSIFGCLYQWLPKTAELLQSTHRFLKERFFYSVDHKVLGIFKICQTLVRSIAFLKAKFHSDLRINCTKYSRRGFLDRPPQNDSLIKKARIKRIKVITIWSIFMIIEEIKFMMAFHLFQIQSLWKP